jgi:hypothetical protein
LGWFVKVDDDTENIIGDCANEAVAGVCINEYDI